MFSSIIIKEKPQTVLSREEQSSGVGISQDIGRGKEPSIPSTGYGDLNGYGTAQSSIPGLAGAARDFTD